MEEVRKVSDGRANNEGRYDFHRSHRTGFVAPTKKKRDDTDRPYERSYTVHGPRHHILENRLNRRPDDLCSALEYPRWPSMLSPSLRYDEKPWSSSAGWSETAPSAGERSRASKNTLKAPFILNCGLMTRNISRAASKPVSAQMRAFWQPGCPPSSWIRSLATSFRHCRERKTDQPGKEKPQIKIELGAIK